ncbi:proteasome subunit beta type 5,8 [Culex quinquefasciatus]|uniref:Proteasome subunit beta type 5,8 n=1 Tax=Culex quinquefasciatus TaxID=7176 RepID=B0XBW8_CULQU|nr:proteasome subunit beta type 5,8 [Culex quinquefasciatus]|eukprot:XP_001867140.1 proteasome subunit beta type 5,8 [Culex quinquefasciatus]
MDVSVLIEVSDQFLLELQTHSWISNCCDGGGEIEGIQGHTAQKSTPGRLLRSSSDGAVRVVRDISLGRHNLENSLSLAVPLFHKPAENLVKLQADGESSSIKMDFDHGTTTLGFLFQGEVILAVDSRATGGQFIGSQTVKKIVEINEYLLGTLADGAADCVVYYYKGMGISMRMMLAGYDKHGPQLCYIDSEGTRTPGCPYPIATRFTLVQRQIPLAVVMMN